MTQSSESSNVTDEVIRSSSNRTLKLIRSLRQRKLRETERAFVVEGYRAIADAIAAGATPTVIAVREGDDQLAENWFSRSLLTSIRFVDAALLDAVSDTVAPQGVVAVFPFPDLPVVFNETPLALVLDQIRDPGNLGTLIRTAAAAGVDAVYLTEGTVDPFNPKAVRSAVGAHFRIPIRWLTDDVRQNLIDTFPVRVVADADGSENYDDLDWTQPTAIVIGSEAHGASSSARTIANTSARIPLANDVESLNAAAAGAILLFEAAHHRRLSSKLLS